MAKKVVNPSQRKELAQKSVSNHDVRIRLACHLSSISEPRSRYKPLLSSENEEIADWLVNLTETSLAEGEL